MPIFVVESTGIGFPQLRHPRLTVVTFNNTVDQPISSSVLEARSLLHAMAEMDFHPAYQTAEYVLKVRPQQKLLLDYRLPVFVMLLLLMKLLDCSVCDVP